MEKCFTCGEVILESDIENNRAVVFSEGDREKDDGIICPKCRMAGRWKKLTTYDQAAYFCEIGENAKSLSEKAENFKKSIAIYPNADAYVCLAKITKCPQSALAILEKAQAISPENMNLRLTLPLVYIYLKDWDMALASTEKYPFEQERILLKSKIYATMGDVQKSKEIFYNMMEKFPKTEDRTWALHNYENFTFERFKGL